LADHIISQRLAKLLI